jgi:hypothetical protein
LISFFLFGDTIIILASVATSPDHSRAQYCYSLSLDFCLWEHWREKFGDGRLALGGCAYAVKNTFVAFSFTSAVSFNAMATSKYVFGAATIV